MVEGLIEQDKTKKPMEKKPAKCKFKQWKVLLVLLFLAGITLLIAVVEEGKMDFEAGECGEHLYLGHCFDIGNEYYMCNIEGNECDQSSWEKVMKIRLFEENNIVIYGSQGCPWCKKQLEEFGEYADYMKEKGIYIECTPDLPIPNCQDVTITPTWKQHGLIVYEGYIPLDQIQIRRGGVE